MKIRAIAGLAAAAALWLGAMPTAASAYPVKQKVLIDNVLYKLGKMPTSDCEEPPVRSGDAASVKRYIGAAMQCLEATWEQYLGETGVSFESPRLKFVSSSGSYCGIGRRESSVSIYCDTGVVAYKLGKDILEDPSDLWLMVNTAALYARHMQQLVLIGPNVDGSGMYDTKAELNERLRRYSLQADCLAGAFVKSIWPLKGRSSSDWAHVRSLLTGDAAGSERVYGKTANVRKWANRGFSSGDAASCNTWTAVSSEVA
ncbi:hypothetical protein [Nonomuraea sp. bgisy101]|uniref:hypothetical protein n=1 Tax=Nonomuraea sp. bgisy101 TaxID=3413784 RepID=UPI003D715820